MRFSSLFVLLIFTLSTSAWADDAVEAAEAGGIVFEKTPELVMQDETLTITKKPGKNFNESSYSIDVDFHFKNISNHDAIRKIAFALPPVQCDTDENSMWRGLENSTVDEKLNTGLKDFSGTVDAKAITFTKREEAVLKGRSITSLLTKLNIPLNPCRIESSPGGEPDSRYRDDLKKYHLLTEYKMPAWTENIYFEWVQTFPAGKVTNIHHHYTPVMGQTVATAYSIPDLNNWFSREKPPLQPLWNRNLETLKTTNSNIINSNPTIYPNDTHIRFCVTPSWIRYRLTTGAYWNGGIRLLKLIIKDDAGAPFAINKFYKNDTVQVSKTQNSMTFIAKNFIPTQDLLVLFLSLPQGAEDLKACGM